MKINNDMGQMKTKLKVNNEETKNQLTELKDEISNDIGQIIQFSLDFFHIFFDFIQFSLQIKRYGTKEF